MNWEEGTTKIITISATAGNATNNQLTPGAGRKLKILWGFILLTNDATVATRYIVLSITTPTPTTLAQLGYTSGATASQTNGLIINPLYTGTNFSLGTSTYSVNSNICVNDNLVINGTNRLSISVTGGVPGDSFSGYFMVQEIPA